MLSQRDAESFGEPTSRNTSRNTDVVQLTPTRNPPPPKAPRDDHESDQRSGFPRSSQPKARVRGRVHQLAEPEPGDSRRTMTRAGCAATGLDNVYGRWRL